MKKIYLLKMMVIGLLFSGYAVADIAIVANTACPEASLTEEQAKNIFLGKTKVFPGGTPAHAIDQGEGRPLRNAFYEKLAGKNSSEMKAYWSKLIFTGKATPPEIVDGDAAVKTWLGANADGIGYIDAKAADATVRVLLRIAN